MKSWLSARSRRAPKLACVEHVEAFSATGLHRNTNELNYRPSGVSVRPFQIMNSLLNRWMVTRSAHVQANKRTEKLLYEGSYGLQSAGNSTDDMYGFQVAGKHAAIL